MFDCPCHTQFSKSFSIKVLNQWKSLPNLLSHNEEMNCIEKRALFRKPADTLVPWSSLERSKSMDFMFHRCESEDGIMQDDDKLEYSTCDLYFSKDFTDVMNASFSERSDIESNSARAELDGSFKCWRESQSSELTEMNLAKSLANRMYSNENLDRVGRNLHKINKWFQRCSVDEDDDCRRDWKRGITKLNFPFRNKILRVKYRLKHKTLRRSIVECIIHECWDYWTADARVCWLNWRILSCLFSRSKYIC